MNTSLVLLFVGFAFGYYVRYMFPWTVVVKK